MAGMLVFDVVVVIVDWLKSSPPTAATHAALRVYVKWIPPNLILAAICYLAAAEPDFLAALAPETVGIIVFCGALVRTFLDYYFGREFLFP
jgi:membrane protein DedA with SNARE-associated domain